MQFSLEGFVYNDGTTTRVTLDRLIVDIPWNAFGKDVIRISNLEAKGLSIDIRSVQPPARQPELPATKVPRVVLDRLFVQAGSLTYSDQGTIVRIPSFSVEAQNGQGAFKLGAPISVSPDVGLDIPNVAMQISDTESFTFNGQGRISSLDHLTKRGFSRVVTFCLKLGLTVF